MLSAAQAVLRKTLQDADFIFPFLARLLFLLAIFCAPLGVRFLALGDDFFLYLSDILLAAGFFAFGIALWRSEDIIIPSTATPATSSVIPAKAGIQTQTKMIKTKSQQWFQVIVLVILATTFASTFFARDPAFALAAAWRTMCFAGLAYIIASGFLSVRSIATALGLIFAGEGLLAVLQFFVGGSVGLSFLGESTFTTETLNVGKIALESGDVLVRAMGTLPHANVLGGLCAVVLILSITQYRFDTPQFQNNFQNFKFLILNLALVVGIFFSFSRAAMAVTGATLIILFTLGFLQSMATRQTPGVTGYQPLGSKEGSRRVIFFLLVALLLLVVSFLPAVSSRIGEGTTAGLSRSAQIEQAVILVGEHPLGVGRGQYVAALQELRPDLPAYARVPVHNFFLLKLVEEGPLVVLAWLSLFAYIFYHTIATRRFDLFLLATALFLLAQVDHYFADSFAGELVFWVVIGALARSEKIIEK